MTIKDLEKEYRDKEDHGEPFEGKMRKATAALPVRIRTTRPVVPIQPACCATRSIGRHFGSHANLDKFIPACAEWSAADKWAIMEDIGYDFRSAKTL